jgi:hypothetical protein
MPYYNMAICDIPFLDIREVIVPKGGSMVTVNFVHHRFKGKLAFTMHVKLQLTDGAKIYTDVKVKESEGIVVSTAIRLKLQEQLNNIFASYFTRLTGG